MDGDHNEEEKGIDFCKLTPFKRQLIKDTWLATPKAYQEPPLSAPILVRKTPFGLSVPALRAKCSPHTEVLAAARNPLPRVHYVTKAEKEAQKELESEMTPRELRWLRRKIFAPVSSGVKKAALTATSTPRIDTMAMARLTYLLDTKQKYFSKLNPKQRKALIRNIKEHFKTFNSNYPPEADKFYVLENGALVHTACSVKKNEPKKRLRYICELTKNQRKTFRKRMKQIGLPRKPVAQDKGPDRGPKKKIKDFEPWITMMSQPRYNVLNEKHYDPFKVKSSAKIYKATERVVFLAKPKPIPPAPPLLDFEGNEILPKREWSYTSRKRIVASPRTIELATPKFVKKKAAEDVKEDPFAVPRRALTAYCSPRTAELAEPTRRK